MFGFHSARRGFLRALGLGVLSLALALGGSAGSTLAQTGPVGTGGPAFSGATVQAKGPLTEQTLPQYLGQLGFQPQAHKDNSGNSYWNVQHVANGFAYKLRF